MQLLLVAAGAGGGGSGDAGLALRCHLRLLSALLPPLPAAAIGGASERADDGAASPAPPAALAAAAEQLAGSPAAVAALEAAVAFLQQLPADAALCSQDPAGDHRRLALVVAGSAAAVAAAEGPAAESRLSLKVGLLLPQRSVSLMLLVLQLLDPCTSMPRVVSHNSKPLCPAPHVHMFPRPLQAASRQRGGSSAPQAAEAAAGGGGEAAAAQELAWHVRRIGGCAGGSCQRGCGRWWSRCCWRTSSTWLGTRVGLAS
jgi:hypothetical protein